MRTAKIARILFYILLAVAPLGTRYIGYMGNIGGVDIEAGTVSMFGTQLIAILFIILALMVAVDKEEDVPAWKKDSFSFVALLIVASAYVSAALSLRFTSSLVVASWIALGAAVFGSVRIVKPSTAISAIALAVGAVLQALLGGIQFLMQEVVASKWLGMAAHLPSEVGAFVVGTDDGRWLRAYGTLPHPNELGMYLAVAAVLSLAYAAGRSGWAKRLGVVAAILCAFGLVLTFSRSAAIGFIAGLVTLAIPALFCVGKWKPRASGTLIIVAVGLIAFVSAFIVMRDPAMSRVSAEGRLERISIEERSSQLVDARVLFLRNSLVGVGPGMMPYAAHEMDSGRDAWDYQYVHNAPLLVAVETGFFGIIAWTVFTWLLI
ncbi:MAG: O-antigen ligase family protein, partial [Patescibacteria group bacterium]|nr:O-antigen ligase family protein [Patescibacteria group bacterium]